ncbi:hypothetical protein [Nocardiopsis synnemataformans]|uniref:hypothetical protein n=1 Tax=Nocardiopsis synnemataformans TaxID=61305 RepID=UPI003EB70553
MSQEAAVGRRVELRFGRLPRLTANRSYCWQQESRYKERIRKAGRRMGREHGVAMWRAKAIVIVHPKTYGRFDPHNWGPTFKSLMDGLVDAGVLPDDNAKHLIDVSFRAGERAQDGPRVDVILEEVLDGAA